MAKIMRMIPERLKRGRLCFNHAISKLTSNINLSSPAFSPPSGGEMCYLLDLRTDSEGQRVESAGGREEDTHRFLKASSRRSRGSLSVMSGWRKRPEDPLSTLPRISTHSRGFSTQKHLSSVMRNRLRFTPGLCKACFRISPKSITMSPNS